MTVDADVVARASARAWERFAGSVPGAWTRRDGGVLAVMTGVDLAGFNGLWGEARQVDPIVVADRLDELRSLGVRHCMQLRPGWSFEVDGAARGRGLVRVSSEPWMVLDHDRHLPAAMAVSGLTVRELGPDEGWLHARVAAAGAVVRSEAAYRELMRPAVVEAAGLRCYVGEVHGEAVCTALTVPTDECVGIFSVATCPQHRRRGYGAAITARAVGDGLASGARWAWLSASDAGYPVYQSLGFTTVEHVDFWEPARRSPV